MEDMVTIYGLMDPRTQELRYVGKTKHALECRLSGHIIDRQSNDHRGYWISNLIDNGLKPEIFSLEVVPKEQANEAEIFWIAYWKGLGARLVNGTAGGTGGSPTLEVREKIRQTLCGRPLSPEHSRKIGNAHKGKKEKPETCAKISAALKGRVCANPERHKLGQQRRWKEGKGCTLETRNKLSESSKQAWTVRHANVCSYGWEDVIVGVIFNGNEEEKFTNLDMADSAKAGN